MFADFPTRNILLGFNFGFEKSVKQIWVDLESFWSFAQIWISFCTWMLLLLCINVCFCTIKPIFESTVNSVNNHSCDYALYGSSILTCSGTGSPSGMCCNHHRLGGGSWRATWDEEIFFPSYNVTHCSTSASLTKWNGISIWPVLLWPVQPPPRPDPLTFPPSMPRSEPPHPWNSLSQPLCSACLGQFKHTHFWHWSCSCLLQQRCEHVLLPVHNTPAGPFTMSDLNCTFNKTC